ncbi:MAG: hypothetical protein ACYC35_00680 [Pirellulales bacterium]|jgi:hypothetical protein
MRYLLLAVVLLVAGCQAGFDSKLTPQPQTPYEWRYDPYTGQRIR